MTARRFTVAALTALAVALPSAGCESGPAGPGTLAVEVSAPVQIGAVVVSVAGQGITAVHGLGGTEVASRRVPGTEGDPLYRVVAFAPDGGSIRIGVDVESTDTDLETFALDAATVEGSRTGVAGVDVRVVR